MPVLEKATMQAASVADFTAQQVYQLAQPLKSADPHSDLQAQVTHALI